jgi:hypothetical protein
MTNAEAIGIDHDRHGGTRRLRWQLGFGRQGRRTNVAHGGGIADGSDLAADNSDLAAGHSDLAAGNGGLAAGHSDLVADSSNRVAYRPDREADAAKRQQGDRHG